MFSQKEKNHTYEKNIVSFLSIFFIEKVALFFVCTIGKIVILQGVYVWTILYRTFDVNCNGITFTVKKSYRKYIEISPHTPHM